MSEQAGSVPEVPFGLAELRGIERVLWGYSKYLKRSGIPGDAGRVQALESMRRRLDVQLKGGDINKVQMFLNGEETGLLLEAMQEFSRLVSTHFPRTAGRDSVIEAMETWQRRLTTIVAGPEAT